ncbi:MAG: 5-oxoprolinase subunit PxpB [Chloroflexi bacterium]|nr:5-oxoprolinase subunit PxpB [Chloroflexota bacterium]
MYDKPLFLPAGDQAVVVELGDDISPETNRRVRDLTVAVDAAAIAGVYDLMPTYRSLLIYFDPLATSYSGLRQKLETIEKNLNEASLERPHVVRIPTLYGGEHGPDLEFVAQNAGISTDEVVDIHSGADYLIYMMGFSPGFPYLGGLSEKLHTPRLETPRTEIPAGSVGIAESQTGVYPVASPGGWRLIGRTPVKMFDQEKEPPSLLAAGDYIRFVPLADEEEYLDIQGRVESGDYVVSRELVS